MSAVVSSAYKMKNSMPISYFLVVVNFEDTTEVVLVDSLVNMSSHHKDPHKKKDTPSESSESHSDSEAEENLEKSKRGKRLTKDDRSESKPLESPNQVGTLTRKYDPFNEPIAGPSGLQEPRLESSDPEFKVESLSDLQKEKEAKDIDENIETKTVERDYDTTSSTPPFCQSSTGITPSSKLQEDLSASEPSKLKDEVDYMKLDINAVVSHFMRKRPRSPSPKRSDYVSEGAHTLSDVSEIRSEIADSSAVGSAYHDAPKSLEKDQSPGSASAVERLSSETSDSNISELPEEFVPSRTPSLSTPSGEGGNRAYLAEIQREADARGEPMSTSSIFGSANRSEQAHLEAWNTPEEIGYYRHSADDPNQDVPHSAILEDQQMQGLDRPFEQGQRDEEIMEAPKVPGDATSGFLPRRRQVEESVQARSEGAGSPSKRRRSSNWSSDSSGAEKRTSEKPRLRFKPEAGKERRMVARKSSPALHSSSESIEPKSSSSGESHSKECPDIKSSPEVQECSKSKKERKSWQTPGLLPSMQLAAMSSKDSVIAEEEDRTSRLREQDTEVMATKDPTPEKMDTTPGEEAAEETEPSESKPAIESSDLVGGS
ncbi:hypothetical protein AVEN_114646-1, partial [Araneus ventricosus]